MLVRNPNNVDKVADPKVGGTDGNVEEHQSMRCATSRHAIAQNPGVALVSHGLGIST